jgi:hypothetical protein
VHQALTRIIELMEEDRRARDTFASVHELLSELSGAACAGRWKAAQQAAHALEQLFGDLEETRQPGFDARLFPNPSLETPLMGALEALGYPAESVERLRATITSPRAHPETSRREALRAELLAFAQRAAGRNDLLLESLAAGFSEAETSRLSRVARGTVRAARSKANSGAPEREDTPAVPPEPVPGQRAPTAPPVMFLAPAGPLDRKAGIPV